MGLEIRLEGDLVKAWRERRGLTQQALAELLTARAVEVLGAELTVRQQQVERLERGIRPRRPLMRLLYAVTEGAIDANVLFGLQPVAQAELDLEGGGE